MPESHMGGEFGRLIAEFSQKPFAIRVYQNGLSVEKGAYRFSGTYAELGRVHFQETMVRVNGIPLPTMFALSLYTPGGLFQHTTRKKEGGAVFREVIARSAPALRARSLAEFEAGNDIDFGVVKISRQRLAVRKAFGGWKEIPLAQVDGWFFRDGYLLIDQNPQKPRLFVEKPIGQVGNYEGLRAILQKIRPEGDLSSPENAQRSIAQAGKLPWSPPIAATRQPGTATGRTRTLILAALPALLILYLLAALPFAVIKNGHNAEINAHFEALAALGLQVSQKLPDPLPAEAPLLEDACAGKLSSGPSNSLAAFFGPLAPKYRELDFGYEYHTPDQALVGSNGSGWIKAESFPRKFYERGGFLDAWLSILSEAPTDWGRALSYTNFLDFGPVKYLAVAGVRDIPLSKGKYRDQFPSRAELFVRVVSVPDGQTLCEGQVARDLPEGYATGASVIQLAPLFPICQAGGALLCEALRGQEKDFQ